MTCADAVLAELAIGSFQLSVRLLVVKQMLLNQKFNQSHDMRWSKAPCFTLKKTEWQGDGDLADHAEAPRLAASWSSQSVSAVIGTWTFTASPLLLRRFARQ